VAVSVLERARAGDERAFAELTAPHVRELHVHCYRMLGSLTDADDVLQEVLVAAWRGLGGFAGRASLRTWLYRIATTRCLNAIRDGRRRPPPAPVPPFEPPEPSARGDVTWLQPYPDSRLPEPAAEAREAVELAFVVALQRLPPRQTAVLVLADVLGFSPAEVAGMLATTPAAVKGALQRARATLGAAPAAPAADPAADRSLARRFAAAFTADDVAGVVALLTDDAWLAMPPAPHEYHGPDAVAAFLRASFGGKGARSNRLVPTRANGRPAFATYLTDPDGTAGPTGLIVLATTGDRVAAITRFLDPRLPVLFGLPGHLGP
jgi:RNA polymerase sigma-70 factor (ECF subfamily)